ncbi:patatin-like phospholipase family protein [Nocardia sp. KC 131]|uniref:patatin-like phospholipase family protein n=1 Tax=Nocardia arseniciresistens TaxID=3392119 RepID=UPI00398F4D86
MNSGGSAVVMGGGGVVGTAWMLGLAAGLRHRGVDLAAADLVVGTSAGSLAGTLITTGADLDELAEGPSSAPPPSRTHELDPRKLAEMSRLRSDPSIDPAEARRGIAALATAVTEGAEEHLAWMEWMVGSPDWPTSRLWVTALDIETGERVAWDRDSEVALLNAVASSCAVPTLIPPVAIHGSRYMDGGASSPTNADLAAGSERLVVIEPIAHVYPRGPLEREIAMVGADIVVTIGPNAAAQAAYGTNMLADAAWAPAYRAGVDQADEVTEELRGVLG